MPSKSFSSGVVDSRTARALASRRQLGISMIEVLVAIVVLSIGALGVAGMQASGMRSNHSSFYRASAAELAHDMADRMRVNRSAARHGDYNRAIGDPVPTGPSLAQRDLAEWIARIAMLPSGDGAIAINNGVVTITVQWDDRRAGGDANAALILSTEAWVN